MGQINRSIELIRYRSYGDELLLFELVNTLIEQITDVEGGAGVGVGGLAGSTGGTAYKTVSDSLDQMTVVQRDRFEALKAFLLALGDNMQVKTLKYYVAFRRIKNFPCVEVRTQTQNIVVYVKVNPDSITLEQGFTRDVRAIGHFGTGELEIAVRDDTDLEQAKPLLLQSYEAS